MTNPLREVVADALPEDHLDSLEGQLRYFLNRIKDFPERSMVELIDANIRERLQNIRAALEAATALQSSGGEVVAGKLEGDDRLLWGVVANAGRLSRERKVRWSHVMDATSMGSTSSAELCRRFDFDPDENVGGSDENETDDDLASPAQPSGFEFVGWASQLQIDRLRSEQDLTGIMVHDEESAARTVRMYAAAPAPIEQEG